MIDLYNTDRDSGFTAGYFWSFGSTAIPLVSAFVTSLIVARWLGPRVVGLLSWTMAVATVYLVFGKFGVEGASSKLISEYRVSSPWQIGMLIRSGLLLRMFFTVPTAIVMVILAPLVAGIFEEPALKPLLRIGGLIVFSVSLNELAAFMVLGLKRFRMLFIVRLVMFLLRVGFVVIAIQMSLEAAGVLGAYVLSALIPGVVVMMFLLRIKGEGRKDREARSELENVFKLSIPLAISGASVTIYSLIDKIMLGYFTGATQVGLYSMARNVLETSLFPTFALVMTLRPALAQSYAEKSMTRCRDLINQSVRNSTVYAFCVIVVFLCLARPLITGLFGEEFAHSAVLLVFFLPLILMRSVGSVVLPGLIAANRARVYAFLTLAGAIVNFGMNILLIPKWEARGAVVSTLVSYIPIAFLGLWELGRVFHKYISRKELVDLLKILSVSVVIVVLYWKLMVFPDDLVETLIHALILVILFFMLSLVLRVITLSDLRKYMRPLIGRGL
jgi:O-antigen/teichoic acid export membrane protein